MSVPAATFQEYQSIGEREDLSDVIYSISPTETPFMSMAGKAKASAVYHEWQTDALAAAAANAQIEGDDATLLTATPTVRLGNYNQILSKSFGISGTLEAVTKAGRKSEIAYQIAKRGKELKRDLEKALSGNNGSTAGAAASARQLASLESWLFTNRTDLGSGGSPTTPGFISGFVAAPTDNSVAGTFVKTALDHVIQAVWTAGGDPKIVLTGPFQKTKAAAFTGIATLYKEVPGMKQATIVGGADVYVSNFGEHTIVPSRFNRAKTVCVLDMDYWAVAYLRPFRQFEIAKSGDSEKRQLLVECTLESRNEAASGKITSLTTS
jgi:hypothetical protein